MSTIFTEERPWGMFRQFATGEPVTVKLLTVSAGQRLSLQRHHGRSEFWHVLSGAPEITVGEETRVAQPGDEFHIPPETLHRIAAGGEDVRILEIATGTFDENDIERIEDAYGRA